MLHVVAFVAHDEFSVVAADLERVDALLKGKLGGIVGPAIDLVAKSQPHWIGFTPDGTTAYVVGNGNSTLTPMAPSGPSLS